MKSKQILLFLSMISLNTIYGQAGQPFTLTGGTQSQEAFEDPQTLNVGIGTADPESNLTILSFASGTPAPYAVAEIRNQNGPTEFFNSDNVVRIENSFVVNHNTYHLNQSGLRVFDRTIPDLVVKDFGGVGINTDNPQANLDVRGTVMIGGMSPLSSPYNTYSLAVNGLIVSKEIIVETTDWADKVFDRDYHLQTLTDLEKYIQTNGHLPEIPTECDVVERGINVSEMNKLLLQKVEELTLYVIGLKKDAATLHTEIKALKAYK